MKISPKYKEAMASVANANNLSSNMSLHICSTGSKSIPFFKIFAKNGSKLSISIFKCYKFVYLSDLYFNFFNIIILNKKETVNYYNFNFVW